MAGPGTRAGAGGKAAGTVHIVGAGLAGLSAAVTLAGRGRQVLLYEAGPAAGGRCRSYFDRELGCRIDNGNHLILAGNHAAIAYLETIGARATMDGPDRALFPFFDLATDERWVLRPNRGRLPWWVLLPGRRVPGTRLGEYLTLARLLRAPREASVREVIGSGPLVRRLLEPLAVSALNARPEVGSAWLFGRVLNESLARGGAAAVPLTPRVGLSESFIDPALARLASSGARIHFSRRVIGLEIAGDRAGDRVAALVSAGETIPLGTGDAVVLAVPAPVAKGLLPQLTVPDEFEAILNVHFRTRAEPGPAGFMALIGGLTEWVFVKPEVVSVTVSAAGRVIDEPAETLAGAIWPEVCRALGLSGPLPPVRVVKEKRATFAATPAQERLRPDACSGRRIGLANLVLAGDWTATGLPATIEGAIRSGRHAAEIFLTQTDG
ncbi:MAG TPA: hydroxysqualene dehydroxylase HpnE [Acetobacteraceae bacterium]|nr:hydroxysqualene dehydroxylase HpnE [Acetobacteraceae bacterium]